MKDPVHPGHFIRTEIIRPGGPSVTGTAAALQVSWLALSSLVNGGVGLSGAVPLRIEKALVMRMQASYNIARKAEAEIPHAERS